MQIKSTPFAKSPVPVLFKVLFLLCFAIYLQTNKSLAQTANLRLGNQVWNDFDGDGKHDLNEPGIPGAPISLYTDNNSDNLPDGAAIRTTTSDASGNYLFTDLLPGRYIASMPILPGYQQSPNTSTQLTSPFPDNDTDDDNNLVRLVGANAPGGILYSNAITLSAGGEPLTEGDDANGNLTFDLAECGNMAIGDFVWNDLNANGIQEAGEPGINNVLVRITFSDGRFAEELTHEYNGNGYYDFVNLGPGTYKISFTTPTGFTPSPANQGSDDAKDSDPVNGAPVTVTLAVNQSDFTIDAGFTNYTPPVANLRLGNQVWNDFDGDGKHDLNEPGIPGAPISLYTDNNSDNLPDGAAIRTTTSDASGNYLFTDLLPGRYIASMPILPGYQQSPNTSTQLTSPFPDNDTDDDNNLVRLVGANAPGGILYSNAITLSAGGEPLTEGDDANGNLTFDLAECGNMAIGDFVWNDLNANGIQEAGEPGINNVLVRITFSDGRFAEELTHEYNGNGYYDFVNLGPGTYKISFTTPTGFTPSPANQGSDDAKDSDPVNGAPVTVTLAVNQSDFTIDAGFTNYTPPVANLRLGNQVWNDFDGDGKHDLNEPGIPGAPISLYTDNNSDNLPDGAAIRTTTSDASGNYLFTDLLPGRYIASMPILPGYQQSPNTSTQLTSPFPDNDTDDDNNLVRLVGANAPGGILYSNAITLSAGGEPSTEGDDANGNLTFDLAECGNMAIGDFVWNDLNANGIQEAGEPGINNVLVRITFSDGRFAEELTHEYNGNGYYDFVNLGPGTYKISFTTPTGFTPSPANQGSDDAKDSDPVNGAPVTVTLAVNQSDFTIDAGFTNYTPPVANLRLGNQVWNDFDGDGKHDLNEPGIPGAPISLYTDNNSDNLPDGAAIKTTTSDASGNYLFTDLLPGRYIASMPILPGYQQSPNTSTQLTSPFPDNDTDDDNNLVRLVGANAPGGILYSNAITLSAGGEPSTEGDDANGNLTFDLAECGNMAIGDFVWNDLNANGIQEAGEPGINNVLVRITFSDGRFAEELTHEYNGNGYYDFVNLGPGTYKISFTTPTGFTPSPANQGSDDAKDSDPVNGAPVTVTLAVNQSDFTIDAGFTNYTPPVANLRLGNQVWNDFDGDGKHDLNEPGIPGAPISLYTDNNSDNLPDGAAIKTTTSDASGNYLFTDLLPGRYIASMPILPGYQQSPNTSTQLTSPFPDNDTDDDNNLVRLVGANAPGGILYSNAITLSAGGEPSTEGDDANGNLTFDLAECGNMAIGDFVWNDLNANGIQEAGEPGINNVLVRITFSDGRFAEELTHEYNGNGYYDFTNLGPGTYKISFTTPTGFTPSPANQGSDDAKDSDPVNGAPVTVTLAVNQSDFTIDAGFTNYTPPVAQCALTSSSNGYYGGFEAGSSNISSTTGRTDFSTKWPWFGTYAIISNVSQLGGSGYLKVKARSGNNFFATNTSFGDDDRIWYKKINVTPGQTINFCAAATLLRSPVYGLKFYLGVYANGTMIKSEKLTSDWTNICGTYTVPQGVTTLELSIRNPKLLPFFAAIDDICITTATLTKENDDNSRLITSNSSAISVPSTGASDIVADEKACNLKVALDAKDPLCFNNRTGSIIATVTGNSGKVSYRWSNGSTGNNLLAVGEGSYYLKVADAEGCEATSEVITLTNPDKITTSISSPSIDGYNIICKDGRSGSIDLIVSGGRGAFTYEWSNEATTQNLKNLPAGRYAVTIKDAAKCPVQAQITLKEPEARLTIEPSVNKITCNNPTGSIRLNVSGGIAPYAYKWSNGASGNSIDKLQPGTYSVEVTDALGCTVNASYILNDFDLIVKATAERSTIYRGNNDASTTLNASATGGSGTYTYTWTAAKTLTDNSKGTAAVNPSATTEYFVTVKDGAGCFATTSVVVNVVNATTAVNEKMEEVKVSTPEVSVTPNPSRGNFNVLLTGFAPGKIDIKILDANGKQVATKQVTASSTQSIVPFNITSAPKGIYFVNVISTGGNYKEKVVIQ